MVYTPFLGGRSSESCRRTRDLRNGDTRSCLAITVEKKPMLLGRSVETFSNVAIVFDFCVCGDLRADEVGSQSSRQTG